MKSGRILEYAFYGVAIAIAAFVVTLNCLQSTPGIFACNYGLTSADFRVKAGAATIFILFIALIFGPVLAVTQKPWGIRKSERRE